MDANGLVSFQIADAAGFGFRRLGETAPVNLKWDAGDRALRLDRVQGMPGVAEDEAFARAMAERPSPVMDEQGSFAFWDAGAGRVVAGGFAPGTTPLPVPPDDPPGVAQPTDMAFGEDDVLYIARNDGVVMVDRRERWAPARVTLAGFDAHRLAPAPGGGCWALDRGRGRLARLTGYPLRERGLRDLDDGFRPVDPNPRPPRLRLVTRARVPEGLAAVDLAVSAGGEVAVLAWDALSDAVLFRLGEDRLERAFALEGLEFPYALAWTGDEAVAVIASDGAAPARQAFVYEIDNAAPDAERTQRPLGAVYRLLEPWHGGFFKALAAVPAYPTAADDPDRPAGHRRLHPLSRPQYARAGAVTLGPLDCGAEGAAWHRAYLEAALPDRTGLRLWAFASDNPGLPPPPGDAEAPDWSLHVAGDAAAEPGVPRAAWLDETSELPFHPGLSPCRAEKGKAGLFTVLMQRPGRAVRRLAGRFLFLHLELTGEGVASPTLAALRLYPKRFSYRDSYLPELYGETRTGAEADMAAPATPPDFLDRFLGLFEGPLTQLEDKVAQSWLLTDPAATPEGALGWLGRWIGIEAGEADDPGQLRQRLIAAPWTARLHGAMGGILAELELATGGQVVIGGRIDRHGAVPRPGEIALADREGTIIRALILNTGDGEGGEPAVFLTGGAVTRGEIVAVEGFRLRRTFATILGADLADEDDPLTQGLVNSGNSYVGDTLILGDETEREFLALFSAELPLGRRDRAAVAAFFERLAHRLLVLVRPSERTRDLRRIAEVAEATAPAHVLVGVQRVSHPLIVAAASLVGIDTFLVDAPEPGDFRVARSALGLGDQTRGAGMLDPRADYPVAPPPTAVADAPASVWSGSEFLLTSARSRASDGRRIVRNIWMWN